MGSGDTNTIGRGESQSTPPEGTVCFEDIIAAERKAIAERRGYVKRTKTEAGQGEGGDPADPSTNVVKPFSRFGAPVGETDDLIQDTIGLSLSGGGIRSAAFCLGVLQALDLAQVLDKVDYLSTVSGGGYIGLSMRAAMNQNGGKFPFPSRLKWDESPSLEHIRDTSNYLFPNGPFDFFRNAAIYTRGLVANFILIMIFLLLAAALTIWSNPTLDALSKPDFLGYEFPSEFTSSQFAVTVYFALSVAFGFLLWGVVRSLFRISKEVGRPEVAVFGWVLVAFLVIAFFEAQPFVLSQIHKGTWLSPSKLKYVMALLTTYAVAIGFVSRLLGEAVKTAMESPRMRTQLLGYVGKGAIWLAAAVVPLIIWIAYLALAYWGISRPHDASAFPWLKSTPGALQTNAYWLLYLFVALVLFLISLTLRPNENSLHALYRDRLSKTFIFQPSDVSPVPPDELRETGIKLSDIDDALGPYPIINAALTSRTRRSPTGEGATPTFSCSRRILSAAGPRITSRPRTSRIWRLTLTLPQPWQFPAPQFHRTWARLRSSRLRRRSQS